MMVAKRWRVTLETRRLKKFVDIVGDVQRKVLWTVAFARLPFDVDEELLEVPAKVLAVLRHIHEPLFVGEFELRRRTPALEISIEWMLIFSVHVDLLEHGKVWDEVPSRTHVPNTVQNVPARSRLLPAKLVRRKREDSEVPSLEHPLQCIQLTIGRCGHASVGGHVDDEKHAAPELAEGYLSLIEDVAESEAVEADARRSYHVAGGHFPFSEICAGEHRHDAQQS